MAIVKPFRAWYYHPSKVSIENVVCPPYDVIKEEENKKLHARDPYNFVRLELSIPDPKHPPTEAVYQTAAQNLSEWASKQILIQSQKDSYYLDEMDYPHPFQAKRFSRLAVFAAVALAPFEEKIVFPHEKTHATAKVDRLHLLRAVRANFSPIFGLYEDETTTLDSIHSELKKQKPLFEFTDEKNIRHKLWTVSNEADVKAIRSTFEGKKIFIADGHHRYETALHYSREKNRRKDPNGRYSWDYVMTALVRFHDPGLLVLPINRVVLSNVKINKENILAGLKKHFNVHSVTKAEIKKAAEGKTVKGFGMAFSETECYLLELKDQKSAFSAMPTGKPKAWYQLDMTQVSYLILEPLLKFDTEHLEKYISYTADTEEAFGLLRDKKSPCIFFVRPLIPSTIKEICESGELMPQKSTFFYPKFPSGLVVYKH